MIFLPGNTRHDWGTHPLPAITAGSVTVDAANAGVRLDGASIDEGNADGILLASSNNAIYGLHLHHFGGSGVNVLAGANNNRIGGALPGQCNIIDQSGNGGVRIAGNGNRVAGNWVGTEDGLTLPGAAGNAGNGVELYQGAQSNTIGGDQPGQGNVIAGSLGAGVSIHDASTANNIVSGNYIGLGADGQTLLANSNSGVAVDGSHHNRIGGSTPDECNDITGNHGDGVRIDGAESVFNTVIGNVICLRA